MTDYWFGGEQTSWATLTNGISYNGTQYRSSFARQALYVPGNTITTTIPPTDYAASPVTANMSNFWFSCQIGVPTTSGANANTANQPVMWFADSGGVIRLLVRGTGTSGQYKLSTRNAAGTLVDLVTSAAGAFPTVGLGGSVQVCCYINYSASGQFQLWINGVNVADTGTGVNITTNSATALNQFSYQNFFNQPQIGSQGCLSEPALSTVNLLGAGVYTIPPVAAGNTQSWTPNTVGNVNKVSINDATGVSTSTANALSEWTVSTTLPTGSWTISSVQQEVRISCGATGPQNFEFLVRTTDGSDHVAGTTALTTSYVNYSYNWATNPHTSASWNAGELINAGVESLT